MWNVKWKIEKGRKLETKRNPWGIIFAKRISNFKKRYGMSTHNTYTSHKYLPIPKANIWKFVYFHSYTSTSFTFQLVIPDSSPSVYSLFRPSILVCPAIFVICFPEFRTLFLCILGLVLSLKRLYERTRTETILFHLHSFSFQYIVEKLNVFEKGISKKKFENYAKKLILLFVKFTIYTNCLKKNLIKWTVSCYKRFLIFKSSFCFLHIETIYFR